MRFLSSAFLLVILLQFSITLSAQQTENVAEDITNRHPEKGFKAGVYKLFEPVPSEAYWYVQTSVFTQHFHPKPEHNNRQYLLGIERNRDDSYIWGGATFINSFEQRSIYAYVGKRYDFEGTPFYSKLTGGLIYGYKGEYRDKVPFNKFKIAPVILPSVGVKYKRLQSDVILLGLNAVILTLGIRI